MGFKEVDCPNVVVRGFTDENVAYSAVAVQRIAAVVMASVVKMLDVLVVKDT